jgi:hypothetical protein
VEPVVAVEAMMAIESVVTGEPAVRTTDGVSPAGVSATAEATTTAVAAASAARVRRRTARENQHSDQCNQPN